MDTVWCSALDQNSGKTYWYNKQTGETTWNDPSGKHSTSFIPSKRFTGCKQGYVFTTRNLQTGYYPDTLQNLSSNVEPDTPSESDDASAWVKVVDLKSGNDYYYNVTHGQTQWKPPIGLDVSEITKVKRISSSGTWMEIKDEQHGTSYYVNTKTSETTWDLPHELGSGKVLQPPPLDSRRKPKKESIPPPPPVFIPADTFQGPKYCYEFRNGESGMGHYVMDNVPDEATASKIFMQPPLVPVAPDASGWVELTDSNTNKVYYHNINTKQTQWEKPIGFGSVSEKLDNDDDVKATLVSWLPDELKHTPIATQQVQAQRATFNKTRGSFEASGEDDRWTRLGLANDRAGRQMSSFFNVDGMAQGPEWVKARERKQEKLRNANVDWKKHKAKQKAKKREARDSWLYED